MAAPAPAFEGRSGGKLVLTDGIATVEGAGGGGIATWATIAGHDTDRGIGGSVQATVLPLSDFTLRSTGIAVGLQTILLSVAAYFFIVGRYGIRVGDRITVAGVTGEVLEVGLVRFYLLELTGSGTELHSTGRVAVFANSVLFQTGTPLYKQLPGTGYAWHEIALKIKPTVNYQPALNAVRGVIDSVYGTYKNEIEKQHHGVELWMDTAIEAPRVEARLQLTDGMQYVVLYPVLIQKAAETDESIVHRIATMLTEDQVVSQAVDGTPSVRAVVKS